MNVHVKMAVGALHPVAKMLVLEMNGLGELLRVVERDDVVIAVAQIALAIVLEYRAENPAVAVVIGELRVRQLRVQLRNLFQKIQVAPQAARGGGLGIVADGFDEFLRRRIFLLRRIHEFAVGFLVPPRVAEKRIHEEIALVHVAVHALARRDGARELVRDRVAALVLADGLVGGEAQALVAEFRIPAGVRGRTVVRVNDVTRRAAAAAVIARMIV